MRWSAAFPSTLRPRTQHSTRDRLATHIVSTSTNHLAQAPWHATDACIVAQHQPALIIDYARSRELGSELGSGEPASRVLVGTGLNDWDAPPAGAVTPHQFLRLLANVTTGLNSADTSFMLGQQMLPGHYGAVSHALGHAASLRDALAILTRYGHALCPLLTPRLCVDGQLATLYWCDSFGSALQRGLLVEMHMTAVTAMCRWLSGARLPWRYCFNRTRPRHTEQHEVHLGQQLQFDCHLDAMLIDAAWLDKPWPRANPMACTVALRTAQAQTQAGAAASSMLSAVYDHLMTNVRCVPTLERTAAAFGVSPATFKRQLARHGSHFQFELDQVRVHVALRLIHQGYDNDDLARYLGFHDANNFRRSFKRWTGVTPMLLRQALPPWQAAPA